MIQEDERGSGGSQGFQWPQVLGPQAQRLYHHLLVGTIFDRGSQSQEDCPPHPPPQQRIASPARMVLHFI